MTINRSMNNYNYLDRHSPKFCMYIISDFHNSPAFKDEEIAIERS